jgi:hypothetical protein
LFPEQPPSPLATKSRSALPMATQMQKSVNS